MKRLYSIIIIESVAIILLSYFLFKTPAPIAPVVFFDKEYERKMDSAGNVIKAQNNLIKRLEQREAKLDTLSKQTFINAKTEHEKINNFNDTTRNAFWTEYFSAKGIYN